MPLVQTLSLFKRVIDKIIHLVKELLAEKPMQYIYLVGGFAESKMLHKRVVAEFESRDLRVIVPMRPQLMVVKGAVLFGLQKGSAIQSRVARFTYGLGVGKRYDSVNHEHVRRGFKWAKENGEKVQYLKTSGFSVLVNKGTQVRVLEKHSSHGYNVIDDDQTEVMFSLYSTTNSTAKFVDEIGMKQIGSVILPLVKGQIANVELSFGNTEILATATNANTGAVRDAQINYNFDNL
jgi:hypothetical protein